MSFDRLAPHYDWMEALTAGDRLQRARTHWLDALQDRRDILSAGEGHGRFAAACLARHPGSRLTCLEASPGMLRRAQQRTRGLGGDVRWVETDVLAWRPERSFDALVTCFFLDCFSPTEAARVVAHLARAAAPAATWIVVDFALPAAGPARWRAQAVHWLMYRFFRVTVALPARRLTAPDPLLAQHGFRLAGRQESDWGLIRADCWVRDGVRPSSGSPGAP
jgi:ubiquinone/menaquinone biosynthesis C-methylase UbiE